MRRELVEKARAGDRDAFATLAAESIGRLFNDSPAHFERAVEALQPLVDSIVWH